MFYQLCGEPTVFVKTKLESVSFSVIGVCFQRYIEKRTEILNNIIILYGLSNRHLPIGSGSAWRLALASCSRKMLNRLREKETQYQYWIVKLLETDNNQDFTDTFSDQF